jgi:hypothetical protein
MKHKVAELDGALLDLAVGEASGFVVAIDGSWCIRELPYDPTVDRGGEFFGYFPSTDWAHGGPIIEREHITIEGDPTASVPWRALTDAERYSDRWLYGPTALIAAMRAFVASKLGDEVELP